MKLSTPGGVFVDSDVFSGHNGVYKYFSKSATVSARAQIHCCGSMSREACDADVY
jgi:hypothetical protein